LLRELWVGDVLVKRFRVPAPNQERILVSFQEQGWRKVIDDPLPVCEKIDGAARLQFTIKRLNRCQKRKVIEFFGIGTGTAIGWRVVSVA
jgi:hypothetical protein